MTRGTDDPPALPWWERVEQLRVDRDWDRSQLARHAGVARTTVDNWKTAPTSPRPKTIAKVAERLGIDKEEAFRLAGILPLATPQGEEEAVGDAPSEPVPQEARAAKDRVWEAMERDPELAIVIAELVARVGGPPPPTTRASPGREGDSGYRNEPGDVA